MGIEEGDDDLASIEEVVGYSEDPGVDSFRTGRLGLKEGKRVDRIRRTAQIVYVVFKLNRLTEVRIFQ